MSTLEEAKHRDLIAFVQARIAAHADAADAAGDISGQSGREILARRHRTGAAIAVLGNPVATGDAKDLAVTVLRAEALLDAVHHDFQDEWRLDAAPNPPAGLPPDAPA